MTHEELDAILFKAGKAQDCQTAKMIALELLQAGIDMIKAIEAAEEAQSHIPYADMRRTGEIVKYGTVDGKFEQIGEADRTHSDKILDAAGLIEAIAYRIRMDAGIWSTAMQEKMAAERAEKGCQA